MHLQNVQVAKYNIFKLVVQNLNNLITKSNATHWLMPVKIRANNSAHLQHTGSRSDDIITVNSYSTMFSNVVEKAQDFLKIIKFKFSSNLTNFFCLLTILSELSYRLLIT